jgi:3-oxoacyl-(acyl-carrier-protein) synthase
MEIGETEAWAAPLPGPLKKAIMDSVGNDSMYRDLDTSVHFALYTARKALLMADWGRGQEIGINIGSSRGATGVFEKYHGEFLNTGRTSALASPTTTLGNISSWVSHDLQSKGPDISHSITCSTALHALLNGIAWIRSGMAARFIAGGSEAPLTPFTIAQMKALKIYAPNSPHGSKDTRASREGHFFPCRALDMGKAGNSMVLGEGASMACLEPGISEKSLATIDGVGYATEPLEHNVSLSTEATCFQRSMRMALGKLPPEAVDILIMHAPGTVKGDQAELRAVQDVFGKKLPAMTSNKWKIGHTFGASGMLSIELALLMLRYQQFIPVPYADDKRRPEEINRVMVNAVGFGGNAVSMLLGRV